MQNTIDDMLTAFKGELRVLLREAIEESVSARTEKSEQGDKLLTIKEACLILKISKASFYANYINSGLISPVRVGKGSVRISERVLLAKINVLCNP